MEKFITDKLEGFLLEDLGLAGDLTTAALGLKDKLCRAQITAKEPFVLCGADFAAEIFRILDKAVGIRMLKKDGGKVKTGDKIITLSGRAGAILAGERTALNIMQRLSGIATAVHRVTASLGGRRAKICDTRKTTPGFRYFEKYAVVCGGGYNHRFGLYDGILIKDNHIRACGGVKNALKRASGKKSLYKMVEIEVSNMRELAEALRFSPEVIMLDNMGPAEIKKAAALIKGRALVEVSGGVTEINAAAMADAGADIISMGALTHSSPSVDLSLDIL